MIPLITEACKKNSQFEEYQVFAGLALPRIKIAKESLLDQIHDLYLFGFIRGFDLEADSKMGLKTIMALGKQQLGGKVEVRSNNGVQVQIQFSSKLYVERVE